MRLHRTLVAALVRSDDAFKLLQDGTDNLFTGPANGRGPGPLPR